LSLTTLTNLNQIEKISYTKNSEIKYRWFSLSLYSNADWIINDVVEFLGSQGRMKFVRPLYRLLRSSEVGSKIAVETFDKFSERYLYVSLYISN